MQVLTCCDSDEGFHEAGTQSEIKCNNGCNQGFACVVYHEERGLAVRVFLQ